MKPSGNRLVVYTIGHAMETGRTITGASEVGRLTITEDTPLVAIGEGPDCG